VRHTGAAAKSGCPVSAWGADFSGCASGGFATLCAVSYFQHTFPVLAPYEIKSS
jgi:hypothetical protein